MLFNLINVTYSLKQQKILNQVSFKVNKGEHLLVLGPSGCGKTTLINLMGGLLRPTLGEIFFEDKNIASVDENELDIIRAMNFGFIFQRFHLIHHLNVEQNIMLVQNNIDKKYLDFLIEKVGLKHKKKVLAKHLSFGEAQRVAIARGIANSPKVIFADEPTSSLDDKNTEMVMNQIFKQVEFSDSTLIVCSHDNRIKTHFKNILEL